ncbi:MAG: efflux RND transporter permease subunit, partial [Gammaproteobacteria bacterium]|nr:efflux RND transporter permease subunit [Gammaproteobacteria bacterium]
MDAVSNLDELRCEAREGLAIAVADIQERADMKVFLDDINAAIDAIDTFPELAETVIVQELNRTDHVVSIAVTAPTTPAHLKRYCEDLKRRLLARGDIPQISIAGFSDHQLRIEFDANTLRQYGLSAADIAEAIRRQSLDQPLGTIRGTQQELLLRFSEQRRSPHELEDLNVIAGDTGAELRLGDIATISDTFEDEERQILFNGERACLLNVTKNRSEDTITVFDAVHDGLQVERAGKPPTVSMYLTQDMATLIRDRLSMLIENGWQGILLAALTLWLFFGMRFAFWVSVGLPVSFLGGFLLMELLGQSINMLSLVALLVALGLLMDDAIVLAENIATHRARGKSSLQAAVDGAGEVAPGVLASFLTTLTVFVPLAFLSGQIGSVLKVIPIVLISVLVISLVEAFLILPAHLHHSLADRELSSSGLRQRFEGALERFRENWIGGLVDKAIEWRYLSLGLVVAAFLITLGLASSGMLKFQGFPEVDGDQIEARVLLPQGTPFQKTRVVADVLSHAIAEVNREFKADQPQQADLVRNVVVRFGENTDAHEEGPHLVTLSVDLLSGEVRNARIADILNRWRELAELPPDVINVSFKEPAIGPGGLPIDIRLQGGDLVTMKASSIMLQEWLSGYHGVSDIYDDLRPGKPELRLRLREGALSLGLDASAVANQLRAAYFGTTAAEIQVGIESYEIDVRLSEMDRNQIADLERFTVRAPNGADVPLSSVAIIEPVRGFSRIQHVNGQRTVTIQGNLDTEKNNATEILADLRATFLPQLIERYPDMRVVFEGGEQENQKTALSMLRAVGIGLVGIFVILSFQFRSYREPLLVMTIIPMAVIGVFWGHLLMGLTLSMPSMLGMISLAGIAVNDSILLVTFIKTNRERGMSALHAAQQACRARFRAVLLTSATTVVGLLPILAENSLQAQVLKPLVASIAFGLVATTVLVLFLIP